MNRSWWQRQRAALARYGVRVVAQPTEEQVTLEQARRHLRITPFGSPEEHPDDADIMGIYLPAAREWCEGYSGLALATQTVEVAVGGFPLYNGSLWYDQCGLPLPVWPVQQVVSINYTDGDGVAQTLANADYSLDPTWPGALYPAYGITWPTARSERNAVRMRLRVGFTTPTESPNDYPLPRAIKNAMLLVMGHLYENRENTTTLKLEELPLAAQHLLDQYRIRTGIA